jgi:hypothetical protein
MSANITGPIRTVTPADDSKIPKFSYIQAGVSGDIVIKYQEGETCTITSNLLDRMGVVPVGHADEVLSTGTTATEIYVW